MPPADPESPVLSDPAGATPPSQDDVLRFRVKAELRKRLRGLRATTPERACQERSAQIIARLGDSGLLRNARGVALFWPIEARREVDLRPLDRELRARGVHLYYPTIEPEDTSVMSFKRVDDTSALAEAGFGFAEPPAGAPAAQKGESDVILVPALAVDPAGYRIGYGKGYYDRTIPRFAPPAMTIAVAYDFQIIYEVPATSADVCVQWIVTDKRVWRAGEQGEAPSFARRLGVAGGEDV